MEFNVGNIAYFWTDKTKSISSRVGFTIVLFLIIFALDFWSGLTYNFHINNKLRQLESISTLKRIYSGDSIKLLSLEKMENEVFARRHLYSSVGAYCRTLLSFKQDIPGKAKEDNGKLQQRLQLKYMILTSSYSVIILLIFLIFLPLYLPKPMKVDGQFLLGWASMIVITSLIIGTITTIAYAIPVINPDQIYWNYILNFIIHSIFLFAIIRISK